MSDWDHQSWNDEDGDHESWDDDSGWDNGTPDDDEADVIPCPNCGTEVYEEADMCPVCGEFIIAGRSPWQGRSPLFVVVGLLGIAAVILVLLGFFAAF